MSDDRMARHNALESAGWVYDKDYSLMYFMPGGSLRYTQSKAWRIHMSSKNQTRHEQLINAGWHYDASTGRYRAPGSADDGTARMMDEGAAWLAFQTQRTLTVADAPPKGTRADDPRKQEPQ